jgi:hypothetical protein
MNAEDMITEVLAVVQDPSFTREADALKMINRGMTAVAQVVPLPGLSDGRNTVTTVIDSDRVALPADFLGPLLYAKASGLPVRMYRNYSDIMAGFDGLSLDAGPIIGCVAHGGQLVYQWVPAVPVNVDLSYYRTPTPMTDSPSSYPDGLGNLRQHEDALSEIIMHFAKGSLYSRTEDGHEGAKVNTHYHLNLFRALREEFRVQHCKGAPHPPPPISEVNY